MRPASHTPTVLGLADLIRLLSVLVELLVIPLSLSLRRKDNLEIRNYLKSTHLLKALLQVGFHGIEHATLDKGGILRLGLIDLLPVIGGVVCRRVT